MFNPNNRQQKLLPHRAGKLDASLQKRLKSTIKPDSDVGSSSSSTLSQTLIGTCQVEI